MNQIDFQLTINTEEGSFEVPMYFDAQDWFDGNFFPKVYYVSNGLDQRQRDTIGNIITNVGTQSDQGLFEAMQEAAEFFKERQGPDSVWYDYFLKNR